MKKIAALFLVVFLLTGSSFATKTKESFPKIRAKIEKIVKGAKILGIEPSPIEDLYIVFIKKGEREGALMITKDGRYVIVGNLLDTKNPERPESVIRKIGFDKGYFKPPKPKKVDMSKINLKNAPRIGKKNAPSVIVYFDPTCPFCKIELSMLRDMVKKGKIAFYPKYFIVHGPKARQKAEEAECIRETLGNEAYWDYLLKGKKPQKMPKCNMEAIKQRIDRDIQEARKIGVKGTPTMVINGEMHVGLTPPKVLESLVNKQVDNKKTTKVKNNKK